MAQTGVCNPECLPMDGSVFADGLVQQMEEVLARCTACGACARVCPMPGPAGIPTSDAEGLTAGILTLLRGGVDADAALH